MTLQSRNRRTAIFAAGGATGMLGLAYASVPLYKLFCEVTGFGGTPQVADAAPANTKDQSITIRFDANVSSDLGWTFGPKQTTMDVKLGEPMMAYYVAENKTSDVLTGRALFNVTPQEAGIFFNKIECFCFTEQTLQPGERVEMPVQFFVDAAIADDADTRAIREITLSYSFFKTEAAKAAATNKEQSNG